MAGIHQMMPGLSGGGRIAQIVRGHHFDSAGADMFGLSGWSFSVAGTAKFGANSAYESATSPTYADTLSKYTVGVRCKEIGSGFVGLSGLSISQGSTSLQLVVNEDYDMYFQYWNGTAWSYSSNTAVPVDDLSAAWQSYEVSYDGGTYRFYFDGVLRLTWTGPPNVLGLANNTVTCGYTGQDPIYCYDEFVVFNDARTEDFTPWARAYTVLDNPLGSP